MVRTLYNLVDHAKIQGKDSLRLFVDAILIGKTRRYFGVRYHAKGRGCREKRDFCQVKLVFEEKPEKQFYESIGAGEASPGVAAYVRFNLLNNKSSYEQIAKYTGITTAKGRQQAKELMRRRVDRQMKENA